MPMEGAREVIAMQFAGGMSIARLAQEWELDVIEVESAIRVSLLATIPQRNGGLKVARSTMRKARRAMMSGRSEAQPKLGW